MTKTEFEKNKANPASLSASPGQGVVMWQLDSLRKKKFFALIVKAKYDNGQVIQETCTI